MYLILTGFVSGFVEVVFVVFSHDVLQMLSID